MSVQNYSSCKHVWATGLRVRRDVLHNLQQLISSVRLSEEESSTRVERRALIGQTGGEHDDRHATRVVIFLQLLKHGQSVEARHANVEQDRVGPVALGSADRIGSIERGNGLITGRSQPNGRSAHDFLVIVDDKYLFQSINHASISLG